MHVSRLRLAGFKSFADPTEVRVETGLTGVVGPNGCGKSNIVDAIRWVMGESSARGLRGGEMDDVIFAGSDARPAFDFAEVGLVLEPPAAVGGTAIEVMRRLGRGVGSSFRLNGREARAKDIARMLADAAAGARSAAIVGQGQIGALVEARPQERQRLLAEAAGIAGLQSRRREAELRLDAAGANLRTLGEREAMLAEQESKLVREAKEAERYRKLSTRHRELQVLSLLQRYVEAERRVEAAESAAVASTAALDRARTDAADARLKAEAMAQDMPGLRVEAQGQATERARLEERLAGRVAEADTARAAIARFKARSDALAEDEARERSTASEAAEAVERLEAARRAEPERRQTLDVQIEAARTALAEADAVVARAELAWQEALAAQSRNAEAHAAAARRLEAFETEATGIAGEREAVVAALAAIEVEDRGDPGATEAVEALRVAKTELVAAEAAWQQAHEAARATAAAAAAAREMVSVAASDAAAAAHGVERHVERADALAERIADLVERRDALVARHADAAGRREVAAASLAALDGEAARYAAERTAVRGAEAVTAVERACSALRDAEAAVEADGKLASETALDTARLEAEAAALTEPEVDAAASADPVLPLAAVAEAHHALLVAALGDDLLAPTTDGTIDGWRGTQGPVDDGLPPPAEPLDRSLSPPPQLAARFAQIGVVPDAATAAALQPHLKPGQRLTTPAGGVWRWDGFVRHPETRSSDGRALARTLRAAALTTRLDAARTSRDDAAEKARRSATHAAAARAGAARAEHDHVEARTAAERAIADRDRVDQDIERADRALAEAEQELAQVALMLAPLDARLDELRAEAYGLGEAGPLRDAVASAAERHRAATEAADSSSRWADSRRDEVEHAERRLRQARDALASAELAAADAGAEAGARVEQRRERLATLRERDRALAARFAALDAERVAAVPLTREREAAAAAADDAAGAAALALAAARTERDVRAAAALGAEADVERFERDREASAEALEGWRTRLQSSRRALAELVARRRSLAEEEAALVDPTTLVVALGELQTAIAELEREATTGSETLERRERELVLAADRQRAAEAQAAAAAERQQATLDRLEAARAALAAADAAGTERLTARPVSLLEDPDVRTEAAAADGEALEHELVRLEASRDRLGAVNLRADADLAALREERETLGRERADLEHAVDELRRAIGDLNREGRARMLEAFKQVEAHFGTLFTRLFGGGRAELALAEDVDDPLAAGLDLQASPPGKRLQALSLLSGGEKALTAIALVFAFFRTQPAPLCVLDEVDAPLDDANVARLGDLMGEIAAATGTRFLVVTHHPLTMARMDRLYGVTMIERGMSSLVSVELDAAVALRDAG
ncbi:MAG: AAA family ATPase [Pseudomonadota bacterium]